MLASIVLDNLAAGQPSEDILKSHPSLSLGAIQSAIACIAELAREPAASLLSGPMNIKLNENIPEDARLFSRMPEPGCLRSLNKGRVVNLFLKRHPPAKQKARY